jgi:hypothetical protein
MAAPLADVTDQPFGLLTAKHRTGKKRNGRAVWLCQCKCGNTAEVTISALRKGDTRSCGCLRKEVGRLNLAAGRARKNASRP